MNRFAVWCAFLAAPAFAANPNASAANPSMDGLLKNVENRYNRSQSLKLNFSETYAGKGHPLQSEAGTLFLRKPGKMRWEYSSPPGKLFLSDGKEVYVYTPEDHRAEHSKLRESDDMKAPLAFLLGKLNFAREFKSIEARQEGPDTWIVAEPKSANLAYTRVEFLATAAGEIHRVRVTGQDQSKLEFAFTNEQLNAPVASDVFTFHAPPGVQVVEAER